MGCAQCWGHEDTSTQHILGSACGAQGVIQNALPLVGYCFGFVFFAFIFAADFFEPSFPNLLLLQAFNTQIQRVHPDRAFHCWLKTCVMADPGDLLLLISLPPYVQSNSVSLFPFQGARSTAGRCRAAEQRCEQVWVSHGNPKAEPFDAEQTTDREHSKSTFITCLPSQPTTGFHLPHLIIC